MPSVLMVIAQETFRDEEYAEPLAALTSAGLDVTTASMDAGTCTGKLGMQVDAQIALRDALASTWDAVLFVGGAGASAFFDDADAHQLAVQELQRGGVIGAICIAPSILARAGVLDGRRATAFPSQKDDLIAHGAQWDDGPVVVDGKIVTACGPDAAADFGRTVVELFGPKMAF